MTEEKWEYFADIPIRTTDRNHWETLLDRRIAPQNMARLISHLADVDARTFQVRWKEESIYPSYVAASLKRFRAAQDQALALQSANAVLAACCAFDAGVSAQEWSSQVEWRFGYALLSSLPVRTELIADPRLQRCFVFGYMTSVRADAYSFSDRESWWRSHIRRRARCEKRALTAGIARILQVQAPAPRSFSQVLADAWTSLCLRLHAGAAWRHREPTTMTSAPFPESARRAKAAAFTYPRTGGQRGLGGSGAGDCGEPPWALERNGGNRTANER